MNNLLTINKPKTKTAAEKELMLKLLKLPTVSGKPMTVSEVSRQYGVSRNTIYKWKTAFDIAGIDGLASNRSKSHLKPCRTQKTIQMIKDLVWSQPNFGAARIAKHLTLNERKVSAPTVQKALVDENLGGLEERYAASEKAVIEKKVNLSDSLATLLAKHNPCFADWFIYDQFFSYNIYIDALPIERYFQNGLMYFLIAVDLDSLYTIGKVWDGRDFLDANSFRHEISRFYEKKRPDYQVNIYSDIRWPFHECPFQFFDSKTSYLRFKATPNGHRVPGAYLFIINKIREEFIPKAKLKELSTIDELYEALQIWLNDFNQQSGPLGFPTFGSTPSQLAFHEKK